MIFDAGVDFLKLPHDLWLVPCVAAGFVLLGLGSGLRALRRDGANRLACSAILLFFLGTGFFIAATTTGLFGWPDWPTGAALRLLAVVLATGAAFLGMVALALVGRMPSQSGRWKAVAALLAGALVAWGSARDLSGMIAVLISPSQQAAAVVSTIEPPVPPATMEKSEAPLLAKEPEPSEKPKPPKEPTVVKDERRGFQLALPDPWKVDRKGENGENPIYRRTWPEIYSTVVAETLVDQISPEQYAELVLNNLRQSGELLDTVKRGDSANGREFLVLESRLRLADFRSPLRYEHWIHLSSNSVWQFVFWSSGIAPARLRSEAEKIMETFAPLDEGIRDKVVTKLDEPDRGWAADWPDAWKIAQKLPNLYQVQLGRVKCTLALASLSLPAEGIPLEDIGAVCLHGLEFPEDEKTKAAAKPWSPGAGLRGMEWRLQREAKGGPGYDYILRVVAGRHRVWLVFVASEAANEHHALGERNANALRFSDSAVEKLEISPAAADFWNEVGLRRFRARDYVASASIFRHAFESSRGSSLVMLENAGHAMELAGEIKPAIALLRSHAGDEEKHIDVNLRLARLSVLDGDIEGGRRYFERCDEKLLERENELLSWMQFLHGQEHTEESIAAARWWLENKPGGKDPRRWLAQSQRLAEQHDDAVAGFRALASENPNDTDLTHELAESLNEAGRFQEALAVLQPLLAANKANSRTHTAIAWSHYGRKWYREAKASFEEALKLSPGDADLESFIREAAAKLGQGNHSSIKETIEPVPMPAELLARLAREKAPADFGHGHTAAWLQRHTSWSFTPGQRLKRTQRMKVRVNDAEGADTYSTITFSFDPLTEKVHLNRLEVFDANGKKVGSAKTEDAYIRDTDDSMASHDQVLHVPAPGVAPGCTIEWEITIEGFAPQKSFPFERVLFANYLPTWIQSTHLTGDPVAVKTLLQQGEKVESLSDKDWKAWVAGPLPAADFEAFSIWAEEERPYLCLGSDATSWKEVGHKYLGDIKDRLPVEPTVAELARQLTRECKDDASKIAVLARHVQKSIAYKAIEFGTRARLPNTASETLRLHYGDCKDTSLLLHQMLEAVGIRSHLALVQNDWKLVEQLPSLDQFNHVIVYLPALGEHRFIDPTDKTLDLGVFPADGFWHARLLVLDPENPRLVSPPVRAEPSACGVNVSRVVSLTDSQWKVHESVKLTGYYASRMRAAFTGNSPADQQRRMQSILSSQGNARVERFTFHGLDDPRSETRLEIEYTLAAPMPTISGAIHASLPSLWEKDYLSTPFVKDRKTDFRIDYPLRFISETKLIAPPGLDESSLSALASRTVSEFATWEISTAPAGDRPYERTIHFRFDGVTGRFPAARYADYHEAWEKARAAWDKTISWPVSPPATSKEE